MCFKSHSPELATGLICGKEQYAFCELGRRQHFGPTNPHALLHIFETHNVHLQFATERERLEKQWDRSENVNTEDLRQAFKRYRAFFDRLLTV
jgi:hypothetical protein